MSRDISVYKAIFITSALFAALKGKDYNSFVLRKSCIDQTESVKIICGLRYPPTLVKNKIEEHFTCKWHTNWAL